MLNLLTHVVQFFQVNADTIAFIALGSSFFFFRFRFRGKTRNTHLGVWLALCSLIGYIARLEVAGVHAPASAYLLVIGMAIGTIALYILQLEVSRGYY